MSNRLLIYSKCRPAVTLNLRAVSWWALSEYPPWSNLLFLWPNRCRRVISPPEQQSLLLFFIFTPFEDRTLGLETFLGIYSYFSWRGSSLFYLLCVPNFNKLKSAWLFLDLSPFCIFWTDESNSGFNFIGTIIFVVFFMMSDGWHCD